MSEWIDFFVFSLQALVVWILLPRWGAPSARFMLEHRNPAWAEAHPQEVARLSRGGLFMPCLYAWGVLSVAVLLVVRLSVQAPFFMPFDAQTPGWERLQNTSNALISVGLIVMGLGFAISVRRLEREVPLGERRQASLAPRTAGQYAPRWALGVALGIAGAHLLAWVVVGLRGLQQSEGYWLIVGGMFFVTAVLYGVLRLGVARRPNHYDLALGPVYRRTEIRAYLAMIVFTSVMGMLGLYREVTGFDTDRMASLVVAAFIIAAVIRLTRLQIRVAGDAREPPRGKAMRTSAVTTMLVPLLLPLTLITLQPAANDGSGRAGLLEVELQPHFALAGGNLSLANGEHALGRQLTGREQRLLHGVGARFAESCHRIVGHC
jgi:hypothetical protein